jgi:serine/threonine-protein kinase HipA
MKRLDVIYEGWGEHWPLGTLADAGRTLLFEYSAEAHRQGLELSPYRLPLQTPAFQGFPAHQWRLPGLIADALPDGWGLLLMDRLFRRRGLRPEALSPLDRLAFIGDRGMGALSFRPADDFDLGDEDLSLLQLAQEAQAVVHDHATLALPTLARLGGSPHGARPKVLVHIDPRSLAVGTQPFAGAEPWLVKFQAGDEHPEVCTIEWLYSQIARAYGIDMPQTHLFALSRTLSAFGIRRFDREDGMRVPTLTMAGALDADFREPSVGYDMLLKLTRMLTRSQAEVDKAYRRVVFNVAFHNRDDHSKNISFRLDAARHWQLAPAYDLTFSVGPGGEHHMDVCGEGRDVTRAHLLRLAKEGDVKSGFASACIDEACELAEQFDAMAEPLPIRTATRRALLQAIRRTTGLLRSG